MMVDMYLVLETNLAGGIANVESTAIALWSGTDKNRDVSTGPLTRPFARSLAPLTRSLTRSLRSLPRSWESEFLMSRNDLVLSHSALV